MSEARPVACAGTSVPLRRTGIERALSRAGFDVVEFDAAVVVAVRTSDDPPTAAQVDVSVAADEICISVRVAGVAPETWMALARVIDELASAPAGRTPLH